MKEESFYQYTAGYAAPACSINDFLKQKGKGSQFETSYPLGLKPAPLWDLLPKPVVESMQVGLKDFIRKMRGFETGNLLGFESKTSSPVQVIHDKNGLCEGSENIYIIGEGSGYAGRDLSSAAAGSKAAIVFVEQ